NKSIQIGKVCAIKVDVKSCEYREDHRNQSDSSDDPKDNASCAIVARSDKCLETLRRELANEILSIQHAIFDDQRTRCPLCCLGPRKRTACEPSDQTVGLRSGNIFDIGHSLDSPPRHLRLDRPSPECTDLLCYGTSTSQEMEDEEHQAHDENDVNESSGNVKCEKPE